MDLIFVQNNHEDMLQKLSSILPESVSVHPVDDNKLPSELDKHKDSVKAIVLFDLTEAATRFCELVRNGRYCHPWTPIAIINDKPTEPGPVGSVYFPSTDNEDLIKYLSKPVSKSILVIEDDKDIRHYLSLCLGSYYNVETATNATDGERLYLDNNYDLLILDVMLRDGINGDELTAKIRETDPTIPILVVTAYDTSSLEADLNSLGATDYMAKPFKGNEVVRSRVLSILSTAHVKWFKENNPSAERRTDDAWQLYESRIQQFSE